MKVRILVPLAALTITVVTNYAFTQNIVFRDITKSSGLFKPLAGIMGHGGAFGDFDGDGWIDIYVGGFCDRPNETYKPAAGPVANRLLRNVAGKRFTQVKMPAVEYFGRTSGAVFADWDNDGDLDLFAANNAKMRTRRTEEPQRTAQLKRASLFRNDKGKFADVTAVSGASPPNLYTSRNIGVFDYDNDGLLDMFIVEDRFTRNPSSVLLRNVGNLRFEDVTKKTGLPQDIYGLGLAVADINEDGRPDFFVPHSNRMFLSKGKNRYYEPASLKKTFAWEPLHNEDWPCGAAFGDLNRDGKLDLVLSIHGMPARNKVFLNSGMKNGVPGFRDVAMKVGMGTPVPPRCPHVEIQDFDNDGWPDIYISAAWMDKDKSITPLIYRNLGVKNGIPRFQPPRALPKSNVPKKGREGAGDPEMVYFPAGPSGDFDKDGRMDLFLINWFAGNYSRLLHNESPKRHWLQVQVVGRKMNRMGIGAQVKIYRKGNLVKNRKLLGFQEVSAGYGYASGQEAICHFGLGHATVVDVAVKLPGGRQILRRDVKSNQRLIIAE